MVELPTDRRMLDLGNGEAWVAGTAADLAAAAEYRTRPALADNRQAERRMNLVRRCAVHANVSTDR